MPTSTGCAKPSGTPERARGSRTMDTSLSILLMVAKATCFLLIALLATMAMQQASARSRHLVWLAALVSLVALPIMATWAPWKLALLPAAADAPGASAALRAFPADAPTRSSVTPNDQGNGASQPVTPTQEGRESPWA